MIDEIEKMGRAMELINSLPDWSENQPVYQMNFACQTKEGTFNSFRRRLPILKDMGVGIIWSQPLHQCGSMMPDIGYLVENGGSPIPVPFDKQHVIPDDCPYCVRDYYSIDPRYGTSKELKQLITDIHNLGMYFMLGVVPNHTSWDNALTITNPEFYQRNDNGNVSWVADWHSIAQLDYGNKDLWYYMRDVFFYWIREFNVDGFRCDVAKLIPLEFWEWLIPQLKREKAVFMLAEANDAYLHSVFDMTYDWNIQPYLWKIIHFDYPATILDEYLEQEEYGQKWLRMRGLTNHDAQIIGYDWPNRKLIDHDFLEKYSLAEKYGPAIKHAAILYAFLPGGKPLVWNGQEEGILEKTPKPINFDNLANNPSFIFYKRLMNFYQSSPAVNRGEFARIHTDHDKEIYAFSRKYRAEMILIILNFSNKQIIVNLHGENLSGEFFDILHENRIWIDRSMVEIQPWECICIKRIYSN